MADRHGLRVLGVVALAWLAAIVAAVTRFERLRPASVDTLSAAN